MYKRNHLSVESEPHFFSTNVLFFNWLTLPMTPTHVTTPCTIHQRWRQRQSDKKASYAKRFGLRVQNFRDTEVRQLAHSTLPIKQNILGLQISVKDVFRMDVLERHQYLNEEVKDFLKKTIFLSPALSWKFGSFKAQASTASSLKTYKEDIHDGAICENNSNSSKAKRTLHK